MFTWLIFFIFFEEIELTANANVIMQVPPSMPAMQKFHASCMHGRFLVPPFDISWQHKCHAARKIIFSFSRRPEKMVFTKKSPWNMIFLVLLGKIIFLFLENMILTLGGKWQMIFFKKIQGNMIFSSGPPKRRSFQKGPRQDMIFLLLCGKMFFFPENNIFSLGRKPAMTFTKKYMEIWYFLCTVWVLQTWRYTPLPKKIKDGLIPQKYT